MNAPPSARQEAAPDQLRLEARALGRFILRRDIDQEFIDRYLAAHNHLFTGPQPAGELALVRSAVKHRWLLPCLDAAAALRAPDSLLHKKALLMSAILEASPHHTEVFFPRRCGWAGLMLLGVRLGLGTVLALAIGLPAFLIVRSRS